MKLIDRILTIVVTATLTSAVWIVLGSSLLGDRSDDAGEPDAEVETSSEPAQPIGAPTAPPDAAAVRPATLTMPVAGVSSRALTDSFLDPRGESGIRRHEAIDIMAPRGTPVVAAAAGRVAKLHRSRAGGRSVYVRSPDGERLYFYANLDAYADGLEEGQAVAAGDPLGLVGTSGTAEPAAPHLHFAIYQTTADAAWWEPANAINPYPLLRGTQR